MSEYYTPDLSEFHIGFEYEFSATNNLDGKIGKDWIPSSVKSGEEIKLIDERKEWLAELFRVKYLDSKDIQELGWKQHTTTIFLKPIKDSPREYFIDISQLPKIVISITSWTHSEGDLLVEATIKNKSELSVLLHQLGI